jgi:UDPglucose--hexose-1-phosphate uridylyltransferase
MIQVIPFETCFQSSSFLNPTVAGELDTQTLELRTDPLTGARSVFNPRLEDKAAMFIGLSDQALIDKLGRDTQPHCFLCEERWKQTTPRYPERVVPGGRIQIGQAVLFPNLFPISQVHAVIRVSDAHSLRLGEFSPEIVRDAFAVALQLARHIAVAEPSARYLTINANFLPPAGASIAHPHFQVVASDVPFTYLEQLLTSSRRWMDQHHSCYWTDLVRQERETGQRFIAQTGAFQWLASFSPQGAHEVLGIAPERRQLLEWDDADLQGLAQGFSRVLRGYEALGASTFNFSVYSGPLEANDDSLRCHVRLLTRQNMYENYRTDDYFLQKLLRNELILMTPEILATRMRAVFADATG